MQWEVSLEVIVLGIICHLVLALQVLNASGWMLLEAIYILGWQSNLMVVCYTVNGILHWNSLIPCPEKLRFITT